MDQVIAFLGDNSEPRQIAVSASNPLPVIGTFEPPPPPEGGATEAEQEAQTALLSSLNTKAPAKGSATSANSTPVVIASDQGTIPTQSLVTTTASGMSKFRAPSSAPLLAIAQAIKASAGKIFGVRAQSPATNVLPTYIKFFNVAAASVTPGTTVPVMVLEVPAFDDPNTGQLLIVPGTLEIEAFSTAISVLATSVLADTGTQTAPTAGLIVEINYI